MNDLLNLIFAAFALLPDMTVELLDDGTLRTHDLYMKGTGEPKDAETMARIAVGYLAADGVGRDVADQIRALLPAQPVTGGFPVFNSIGNQIG